MSEVENRTCYYIVGRHILFDLCSILQTPSVKVCCLWLSNHGMAFAHQGSEYGLRVECAAANLQSLHSFKNYKESLSSKHFCIIFTHILYRFAVLRTLAVRQPASFGAKSIRNTTI